MSPFASEAPSEPKERTDWRTTTPSQVIDQSNRPGSFLDGVIRSWWGFGLKVIMLSMWGHAGLSTREQRQNGGIALRFAPCRDRAPRRNEPHRAPLFALTP